MAAEYLLEWSKDIGTRYLDYLLTQWRQPRREGLVTAVLSEVQALEDAAQQVYRECNINDAVGEQLNRIGRLLLVPRNGLPDDVYRTRLRVEIAILTSNGTPEDVIAVVRAAVTPGVEFHYRESYPAGIIVEVLDPVPEFLPPELLHFLNRARARGVRIGLLYSSTDAAHSFTFADGTTPQADTNRGFGSATNPAIGGKLVGVYS